MNAAAEGGVIGRLLANLLLHYAFDLGMGAKLVPSAVRAVRGRYHCPLQDRGGSEPGVCQNSGTVEGVGIGTAAGEERKWSIARIAIGESYTRTGV